MKCKGNFEQTLDQMMKATAAFHKLGDISREDEDFCWVYAEDEENFYGNWLTGYGFFDVKSPKKTTRSLTEEEAVFLKKQRFVIL